MSAGQDAIPPIPAGSRYAAMGSSFGAGPGIAPRAPARPRRAGRSAGNYAHLVARALHLDLHDVTYSGATTSDILTASAAGQPAQLDAVTPDTRLVTITAGGNDVGFLPRLTLASLPWPLRALPRVKARVAGFGDPDATEERFAQLEGNLAMIGRRLRDRAPACRVLFVDYLTILPPRGDDRGGPRPRRSRSGGVRSPPGSPPRRGRRPKKPGASTSPPRSPQPVIMPGRRPRGRATSTCRCAAGRRTTPMWLGWRPWPNSCSRPWPGRLAGRPAENPCPFGLKIFPPNGPLRLAGDILQAQFAVGDEPA